MLGKKKKDKTKINDKIEKKNQNKKKCGGKKGGGDKKKCGKKKNKTKKKKTTVLSQSSQSYEYRILQWSHKGNIPSWQLLRYPSFPWTFFPALNVGNARMVPDIQTQKAAFSHVIYRQEESCMSNYVKKLRNHIL